MMENIHISSKVSLTCEGENQHAIITNANTSNGIKTQLFWKKSGG